MLRGMDVFVIGTQVLLLMLALPLMATSLLTSRGHRSRHAGFMAVAALLALVTVIVALASVGLAWGSHDFDHALAFVPPMFTLALCAWVAWRALGRRKRPQVS